MALPRDKPSPFYSIQRTPGTRGQECPFRHVARDTCRRGSENFGLRFGDEEADRPRENGSRPPARNTAPRWIQTQPRKEREPRKPFRGSSRRNTTPKAGPPWAFSLKVSNPLSWAPDPGTPQLGAINKSRGSPRERSRFAATGSLPRPGLDPLPSRPAEFPQTIPPRL